MAVMCETHWTGLSRPSWERGMDLQFFCQEIISRYWAGTPNQHRQTNRMYHRMRFLVDPAPIKLLLSTACHTTSTAAVRDSWCLQVHFASAFAGGVQHSVD